MKTLKHTHTAKALVLMRRLQRSRFTMDWRISKMIPPTILAAAMLLTAVVSTNAQEASSTARINEDDREQIGRALADRIHRAGDSMSALFTITEFAILYPMGRGADVLPSVGVTLAAEMGFLQRIGRNDALGMTAVGTLGRDNLGLGGKLRYRHWLSRHLAVDVGVGGVVAHASQKRADEYVGTLGLNLDDHLHFVIHYENYRVTEPRYVATSGSASYRASDLFVGMRLGGEAGMVATAATLIAIPFFLGGFDMGPIF